MLSKCLSYATPQDSLDKANFLILFATLEIIIPTLLHLELYTPILQKITEKKQRKKERKKNLVSIATMMQEILVSRDPELCV